MIHTLSHDRTPRLAAIALIGGLSLVLLAACGGNPAPSPAAAPPTQPPSTRAPVAIPSPSASVRTFTIQMTSALRFDPAQQMVPLGATVVWTNTSSVQHTATDDPNKAQDKSHAVLPPGAQPWDSGLIDPGKTFQHTFTVPGTYHYFCIPHEARGMLGTIVVQG